MSEPIKQASIHFQLLIFATVLFLVVFFWVITPQKNDSGQTVGFEWSVTAGLSAIAGYLAFVVLVVGHAQTKNKRRSEPSQTTEISPHDSL